MNDHLKTIGKYILEGKIPVEETDLITWAKWMEKGNKVVKQTDLRKNVRVSTVFLGIDHAYLNGPPMLFETMIFGGEHDEYCERYSTWEQAEKGHEEAINLVFS